MRETDESKDRETLLLSKPRWKSTGDGTMRVARGTFFCLAREKEGGIDKAELLKRG